MGSLLLLGFQAAPLKSPTASSSGGRWKGSRKNAAQRPWGKRVNTLAPQRVRGRCFVTRELKRYPDVRPRIRETVCWAGSRGRHSTCSRSEEHTSELQS